MVRVARPKWFAKRRDELGRGFGRSAVGRSILARNCTPQNAIAVQFAGGVRCMRWRYWLISGAIAFVRGFANAVGLGARTCLRCIASFVAELVELCGKSGLNLLGIRCGELVFERQNPLRPD